MTYSVAYGVAYGAAYGAAYDAAYGAAYGVTCGCGIGAYNGMCAPAHDGTYGGAWHWGVHGVPFPLFCGKRNFRRTILLIRCK